MKFATAKKRATKAPINDSASCGYCGFAGTTGAVRDHLTEELTCPKRALRCTVCGAIPGIPHHDEMPVEGWDENTIIAIDERGLCQLCARGLAEIEADTALARNARSVPPQAETKVGPQ